MLQPTSQHFGPSSELYLQWIVLPSRNVNPRVKHLTACHDFGTRNVVLPRGRNRPVGVSDGLFLCVSFYPHVQRVLEVPPQKAAHSFQRPASE